MDVGAENARQRHLRPERGLVVVHVVPEGANHDSAADVYQSRARLADPVWFKPPAAWGDRRENVPHDDLE